MSNAEVVTIGVDGSESSLNALNWAVRYAESRKLAIRVVSGLEVPIRMASYTPYPVPDVHEAAESEGRRIVDRAVARCHTVAPGLDVAGAVVTESPVPALLHASRTSTLVVVGSRGRNPMATALLGSVSAAVASHAHCPVAVIRVDREAGPHASVVAGVDGSGRDDAVLAAAFDEAERRDARLLVAHAWSDTPVMALLGAAAGVWPTWDKLRAEASMTVERQLAPWRNKHPNVGAGTQVVCDQPGALLLELGHSAGLVVVGSHGRGGFAGMLLGSVARRLVHHADCPVLVVRTAS